MEKLTYHDPETEYSIEANNEQCSHKPTKDIHKPVGNQRVKRWFKIQEWESVCNLTNDPPCWLEQQTLQLCASLTFYAKVEDVFLYTYFILFSLLRQSELCAVFFLENVKYKWKLNHVE